MEQLAMTEYSRQYTTAAQNRADCSQFMALKEGDRQVALGRLVALARPAPSSWQPGRLQAVSTVIPKVGASQAHKSATPLLCVSLAVAGKTSTACAIHASSMRYARRNL